VLLPKHSTPIKITKSRPQGRKKKPKNES
jgi:hypothetical protein